MMCYKSILGWAVCTALLCGCQEDFDSHLQREAKSFTEKHCPKEIEAGNTLDSATYDISTRTYTQWFTFSGFLDSSEAQKASLAHLDKIKVHLLTTLRGDTKWETCKDKGINFSYVYRSASSNKTLFHITLTPEDYRN